MEHRHLRCVPWLALAVVSLPEVYHPGLSPTAERPLALPIGTDLPTQRNIVVDLYLLYSEGELQVLACVLHLCSICHVHGGW
ncbi:uncharacterized protein LY79DRAFT_541247 [Colletotrichum navitas]|uniref:Secreted protein n=1 Tax=Colletotrichum navitas TaxID=681940 RepID=A0AAD8Q7S9_9PEZI|nr:uncharacterized protein LY79DRAFT_541247 [Colletotrichum navitas]KAK1597310.1 hypothetical protein LY79DRAFT_541247 [Colletotrichum navitas]